MEIGGNTLNFLDISIINNKGIIEFDWYHKPTFLERYLNFLSNHPISQKNHLKSKIYETKPTNLEELRQRIVNVLNSISPECLSNGTLSIRFTYAWDTIKLLEDINSNSW
ncbi:hypothetical protein ALC62_02926 [Cyphomyrmex costatus]|uniref:Uncharacterized protein n=1 Tax=Cyphomyrmex costatus TaxID=456900 RepID=A0A195CZS7_9HYME|nr:hypothetical protein ALC62_02926 [Cyphomyrmex costatus]